MRKTGEFWSEIGERVGHSGEQTERLFKNLAADFQKIKQGSHVSGVETEHPVLRGSHDLYLMFESYYSLYFPHGGSTLPSVVLTENTLTFMLVLPLLNVLII